MYVIICFSPIVDLVRNHHSKSEYIHKLVNSQHICCTIISNEKYPCTLIMFFKSIKNNIFFIINVY